VAVIADAQRTEMRAMQRTSVSVRRLWDGVPALLDGVRLDGVSWGAARLSMRRGRRRGNGRAAEGDRRTAGISARVITVGA